MSKSAAPVETQLEETEQTSAPPVVLIDGDLLTPPDGRPFWLDDDMFPRDGKGRIKPQFTVQDVAKVFLGKGPDWLRWRMGQEPEGTFYLDGEPLEIRRTPKNARYFTLADIEKIGHSLAQPRPPLREGDPERPGVISGEQLARIIKIVKLIAEQYGIDLEGDGEFADYDEDESDELV